jgi:membrane glycosyltransferase
MKAPIYNPHIFSILLEQAEAARQRFLHRRNRKSMHAPPPRRTPANLQSLDELARRRRFAAGACAAIYGALLVWLGAVLLHGAWSGIGAVIFICFALAAPWSVLGFFNSMLGFWLLHIKENGLRDAAPFIDAAQTYAPLGARVAILLTIRNEDAKRAIARLRAVKDSLDATPQARLFDFFVLSDTSDAAVAAEEESAVADWRAADADARLHYRRRRDNSGYKAGNIRDFCERWGGDYTFMIPLDADSLMDGDAIVRLLRIGEAFPNIGIVQSLVVGAPSASAFARLFQFGMRAGMRSYTMGASWWAGDCGPFWGHNALLRVAPFTQHCTLPALPGGAPILSHDQIEAALMRRAGYEVRVLPIESGSYEENPPTLLDFLRRDLRWCEGNMQYVRLLALPGLSPMSRFQLIWAVSMFLGAPAWTAIIVLSALTPLVANVDDFPTRSALAFYFVFLLLHLAPKLAGYLDAALTPGALRRYGGCARFALSALIEIAASFVIGGVTTLNTGAFLIALAAGRKIGWDAQRRDARGLSWRNATRALWPHTLFGAALFALAGAVAPALLLWSLPLTLGYVAAIPFAVASAAPVVGRLFAHFGLCAAPEEVAPPPILRAATPR